jgi:5-methylcytosine-specific restriction enzyme subunit McrC
MSDPEPADPTEQAIDEIQLSEHDEFGPLPEDHLTEADERFIESEMGDGTSPLRITYNREGRATIHSSQFVGVVALPSGLSIEIRPKAAGTNFLWLLQYSHGVDPTTVEQQTTIQQGYNFLDALAGLFEAELSEVLHQGLHRQYRRTEAVEDHLRGRLDVQRQLQRQGPFPLAFEVEYDELTEDTVINRGILRATDILAQLTDDERISEDLQRHYQLLQKRVTPAYVDAAELEGVQLNRLNDYYADLLNLTKLVLRGLFVEEIRLGSRSSFGLLVNMNHVFERAVERAAREVAAKHDGWTATGQGHLDGLIVGDHAVNMRPDFLLRDEADEVVLVGDAKWKTGSRSAGDIYQMAAYQLAHDVPGVIVYPEQGGDRVGQSVIRGEFVLESIELPTAASADSFEGFATGLETKIEEKTNSISRG